MKDKGKLFCIWGIALIFFAVQLRIFDCTLFDLTFQLDIYSHNTPFQYVFEYIILKAFVNLS